MGKTNINKYYVKNPTEIITTQLGIPQRYKQECIKEAYKLGNLENKISNVKALMSSWWVYKQTNLFNPLLNQIDKKINTIFPLKDERYRYEISNVWSAVYQKGHYTQTHDHLPFIISFVYFLKSNGSTPLIFDNCDFKLNPKDDDLIIFPSYLFHSVPTHQDKEDRIVIAGNIEYKNK